MPILAAILVLLGILVVGLLLIPVTLVQRYRVGTSRQRARGWLATLNVVGLAVSTALFLVGAAVTNVWVPHSFSYTILGCAVGALLGLFGLWLTRWENDGDPLHFTPNRWLVLGIVLAVAGRIGYGLWRAWESWQSGLAGGSWVVARGAAESLAAGAVVLGYYLVFWTGVRRRLRRHRERVFDARTEAERFERARPVPARPRGTHA